MPEPEDRSYLAAVDELQEEHEVNVYLHPHQLPSMATLKRLLGSKLSSGNPAGKYRVIWGESGECESA